MIDGKTYKLNKINAMIQFHIFRRAGAVVVGAFTSLGKIGAVKAKNLSEEKQFAIFAKESEPILQALARLSDADSEYVLNKLLGAVEVHQPEHNMWARVANPDGGMMIDLELPVMLQLAAKSFMFNIKGFFSLLPQKGSGK